MTEKDKQKQQDSANAMSASIPAAPHSPGQVGAYAPDCLYTLDLSDKQWDKEHQKGNGMWRDTAKGRLAIRMFSRGVLGAGTFAWAGWYASHKMHGYTPGRPVENWVQGIARAYDVAVGKPIEAVVNALGHDGKDFLTFRPTKQFMNYEGKGRSLGHEVVGITFDFGAMSIGDYWGRRLAQSLDPNQKLSWMNDDGSIKPEEAANQFVKNAWKSVTYAAGEDWFVAVPYALTMRHLGTPMIDKIAPGYQHDFDHLGATGSSILIDDNGKVRSNLSKAGVLNIWERFTTYNVGTLWFREAYNNIASWISQWQQTGEMPQIIHPDPKNPDKKRTAIETAGEAVDQFTQWTARAAIKAPIYMIPAVPFFWMSRVPQHKYKGFFVHPEKGILMYGKDEAVRVNQMVMDPLFTAKTPVHYSISREAGVNPFTHGPVNFNRVDGGWVDTLLKPIGMFNDAVRETFNQPIGKAVEDVIGKDRLKKSLGVPNGTILADTYLSAAAAYTPYFWVKSDVLGDKWDYGRTDVAVERALQGASRFDGSEVVAGLNELKYALRNKPLPDPEREKIAKERIATDISASDSQFDNSHQRRLQEQLARKKKHAQAQSFSERFQPRQEGQHPAEPTQQQQAEHAPQPRRAESFVQQVQRPGGFDDLPPNMTIH